MSLEGLSIQWDGCPETRKNLRDTNEILLCDGQPTFKATTASCANNVPSLLPVLALTQETLGILGIIQNQGIKRKGASLLKMGRLPSDGCFLCDFSIIIYYIFSWRMLVPTQEGSIMAYNHMLHVA